MLKYVKFKLFIDVFEFNFKDLMQMYHSWIIFLFYKYFYKKKTKKLAINSSISGNH